MEPIREMSAEALRVIKLEQLRPIVLKVCIIIIIIIIIIISISIFFNIY